MIDLRPNFLRNGILLVLPLILVSCRESGELSVEQKLTLANERIGEMEREIAALKAEKDTTLEKLREAEMREKETKERERNLLSMIEEQLKNIGETLEDNESAIVKFSIMQSSIEKQRSEILEKSEKATIAKVDLHEVSGAISSRVMKILEEASDLTKEEERKLKVLASKRRDLEYLLNYGTTNIDFRTVHRLETKEPTPEVMEKIDKVRLEICELEEEVGDKEIPSVNSFKSTERAVGLVLDIAQDKFIAVINTGFHGSGERVIYQDDDLPLVDITPLLLQEVQKAEDGSELLTPPD